MLVLHKMNCYFIAILLMHVIHDCNGDIDEKGYKKCKEEIKQVFLRVQFSIENPRCKYYAKFALLYLRDNSKDPETFCHKNKIQFQRYFDEDLQKDIDRYEVCMGQMNANFIRLLYSQLTLHNYIYDHIAFTTYQCIANQIEPFKPEEMKLCTESIYEKFRGLKYKKTISQYAMRNFTINNFPDKESRYAREYYQMFKEHMFVKRIKSPKRYCDEQPYVEDRQPCKEQLKVFGDGTKINAIVKAFYFVNEKIVKNKPFAKNYLKQAEDNLMTTNKATNPDEFCANKKMTGKNECNEDEFKNWTVDDFELP